MTLLAVLATVFGIIGALGNIPQVIKIYKRKSAKDISVWTWLILSVGSSIWILYGIEINSYPLIIGNIAALICFITIIVGWFLYGR
jgi:MtN3 and saliva related transmembrane protein